VSRVGWPSADPRPDVRPPDVSPTAGRHRSRPRLGTLGVAAVIAAVLVALGLAAALLSPLVPGRSRPPPADPGTNVPSIGPDTNVPSTDPGTNVPSTGPSPPIDAALGVGAGPTAGRGVSPRPTPIRITGDARLEDAVVALVNRERHKARCKRVRTEDRLRAAARLHSADMATNNFVGHTGSDGSSPSDRTRRAGYGPALSENIARGYGSAEDVMRAWLSSPGHRRNILDCDAEAIGVGVVRTGGQTYWTQDFGRAA
jgi:uncharacterized protein YkwD